MGVKELSPQQRAFNGFEFLNLREEGWMDRINLDLLDINHGWFCVLGQVFADNDEEVDGYDWALAEFGFGSHDAEPLIFFGFYSVDGESDGPALTDAWRALIRGEAKPAKAPVVGYEDQVEEGQCGEQVAYGLPWSEYCIFPKGEDMERCPGHEREWV
jgi:hypothetical protein